MQLIWHDIERKQQWRQIAKAFIPRFVRLLISATQYRKRFPKAFVSADSKIIHGAQIGDHAVIRHSVIDATVSIGECTTIGHRCRIQGRGDITIGRFCSIAPESFFWSENHRLDRASTFPFEQFMYGEEDNHTAYQAENILIGHDVWIGQRAMILAGAHVGHGCVIAAGSVVSRGTYPPYSVIAGVPARVVKMRFPDDTIDELLAMAWWDKPIEDIFEDTLPFFQEKMEQD